MEQKEKKDSDLGCDEALSRLSHSLGSFYGVAAHAMCLGVDFVSFGIRVNAPGLARKDDTAAR